MLNYAVGYVYSVVTLQRHTPAFQYVLLPVVWEALSAVDAKPLKRASENRWEQTQTKGLFLSLGL